MNISKLEAKGYKVLSVRQHISGDIVLLVETNNKYTPWVTGRANAHSLAFGEWYWGHYFNTLPLAVEDFNSR